MSKVKIQGNASGTGVLTVTAPNTSTDRTITLPDESVTLGAATPSIDDNGDATAITIDSSERVGIGTGSPAGSLEIKGSNASEHLVLSHSSGSSYTSIGQDSSDNLRIYSGTNERMRILAGGGITFNGDTAAANALDDYEEGYYTVSISGSTSGSFNMAGNDTLAYTKIGRLVTIQGYIGAQSGSVGGNVRMSLPFAPTNLGIDDQTYNFPSVMLQNQGHTIAGQKYLFLQADGSAYLYRVTDAGSANYISNGDVDGNFEIGVSFTYISG